MDALFTDFATLNKAVEDSFAVALAAVETASFKVFKASVKRTVQEWKDQFEAKCPETVARFIAEYEKDTAKFMMGTCPKLLDYRFSALTGGDFKGQFLDIVERRAVFEYMHGTSKGNDNHEIRSMIAHRGLLTVKFWSEQKNTQTLAKLANDEEGSKAQYCAV